MADEGFLRRWSRRKTETRLGLEPALAPQAEAAAPIVAPAVAPEPAPAAGLVPPQADPAQPDPTAAVEAQARLPTLEDVARLTPDSDFSAFVARGVDQAVRRSALKKLFSDPHFNVMDRLDIYIDDYNKPSPMPEGMLDQLKHANSFFQRVAGEDEQAAADTPPDAPHIDTDDADTGNTEAQASTITTPESETR